MKKYFSNVLAILLLFGFIFGIFPQKIFAQATKPIEFGYVTFLPRMVPTVKWLMAALSGVEEASNGQLKFKNRGGPESIAPPEQATAVQSGAVDMAYIPVDLYTPITAAPSMLIISEILSYQQRETGAYDYLVKLHEEVGLRYLFGGAESPWKLHSMVTNKRIEKPQELAGLRIPGSGAIQYAARSLGMKPLSILHKDYYTAMERGLIDAVMTAVPTLLSLKINEVGKYLIQPSAYTSTAVIIMNLKKWESLPKELQDLMIDTLFIEGPKWNAKSVEMEKSSLKVFADSGVETITFTGEDAEWFFEKLRVAQYDYVAQKAPVKGPKLYKMLRKDALKK